MRAELLNPLIIAQKGREAYRARKVDICALETTLLQCFLVPLLLQSLSLLLIAILPLTACSGGRRSCVQDVTVEGVTLCLARGWERVSEDILKEKKVPEETVAAFHRTDERGGQRDNIVITRESLPGKVSDLAYAEANIKSIAAIPEYSLIEKREVKIEGDVTQLHIFTGRPVPDIPARRFYQLSLTEGTTGYTFTGTLPYSVDEKSEEALLTILQSARFGGEKEEKKD